MKKFFLILLMSIAGGIVAAAQEYWRPSAELVERARQEPVIREHIERYISFRRSIESEKSLLDIHYTIQPDGIHISQTLKYDKYSNMQDFGDHYVIYYSENDPYITPEVRAYKTKTFESVLCLTLDQEKYSSYNLSRLCDAWMTWLFYITGYSIYDEWDFKRPKKERETTVTTSKDIADAAIKICRLKDWSRDSQIALLNRYLSDRTSTTWGGRKELQTASQFSDVKSVSSDGIEVCAALLDRSGFDAVSNDSSKAVEFIYKDNPLVVIAARTLGLPLCIHLYDMTRFGTKTVFTINPEAL